MIQSFMFWDESNLQAMRELIKQLPQKSTIPDFEELMLLESIRATTRLWRQAENLAGFAFVDEFNNLWFEIDPRYQTGYLAGEIVAWGIQCMQGRNAVSGRYDSLDAGCSSDNFRRIAMLEKNGFVRQPVRTLRYARSLDEPPPVYALPPGFSLRPANGEGEVEELVALHRAAFGTENMTVERRLAIMRAPQYRPELDYVAVAPTGELCGFCICEIDPEDDQVGYTDPIGVHPRYLHQGIGKAIICAVMQALKQKGITRVETGTSSENTAMQQLAETLGFRIVSEGLWYSKTI